MKTLVVGDSVTAYSTEALLALEPAFTIDGVPGRNVAEGLPAVEAYLETHVAPNQFVCALGTNWGGATKQKYLNMVDLMRDNTLVMFVLPYRDPVIWGIDDADKVAQCCAWMREIRDERPLTCLAPWKTIAANHPEWLLNGVHPTDPEGRQAWAEMVSNQLLLGDERSTGGR